MFLCMHACCFVWFLIAYGNDDWTFVSDGCCISLRKARISQVLLSALEERTEGGWDWTTGRVNENVGHLLWLFIYPLRKWKKRSFLSSVGSYGLFVQKNALILFLSFCNTVFLFPFQFVFVMTFGSWIKMLHIHKETVCSLMGQSTFWINHFTLEMAHETSWRFDSEILWLGCGVHTGWCVFLYHKIQLKWCWRVSKRF